MTDPTPETTPTRDEALFRALIEELRPYAARPLGSIRIDTDDIRKIVDWFDASASAPAPANGRVGAVARRAKYLLNRLETDDGLGIGEIDTMLRMAASLSPAATPVSEAGGDMAVFPADGELMVMENGHRSCDFERWSRGFELPLHMAESGLGRFYADDRTEWAWHSWSAALAKPASSPAPVRPIGNQGISDYQREIARNMAEGFAAWNAARQEALPSDEPAFSPAGGDVEAAAIERQACAYLQFEAPPWVSNDYSKGFWDAIAAYRQAINFRSSLSPSTSAGRVGE